MISVIEVADASSFRTVLISLWQETVKKKIKKKIWTCVTRVNSVRCFINFLN